MDKKMNIFYLVLILLLSGCNLFDSGKKETEPEFEQYFNAEINGSIYKGTPNAFLSNLGGLPWLNLFAMQYDSTKWPYAERIGFSIHFNSEKSKYGVIRKQEENGRSSGGYFTERDGDAIIARYEPIPDSVDTLTIQIGKDEEGRRFVTGTFAMTVVVDPGYDDEHNNRYRQQPDTVRITNGEFRVLLEERE